MQNYPNRGRGGCHKFFYWRNPNPAALIIGSHGSIANRHDFCASRFLTSLCVISAVNLPYDLQFVVPHEQLFAQQRKVSRQEPSPAF